MTRVQTICHAILSHSRSSRREAAVPGENLAVPFAKFGSFIVNVATLVGLGLYISDRRPTLATKSGPEALGIVVYLTLLVAIFYGVLWIAAEWIRKSDYGAGGTGKMPAGWGAVVLSLTLTVPLGIIPVAYQRLTGVGIVYPLHWRAFFILLLLGAGSHLLIYGTDSEKPNGLRQRILPEGSAPDYSRAVFMEVAYGLIFFSLMVIPYRLIANPTQSIPDLIFGRTLLPAVTFICGMAFFIVIEFPHSMNDPRWIQTRGLIGGILTAFCLCGGMFM
jgi:hypothetical protein